MSHRKKVIVRELEKQERKRQEEEALALAADTRMRKSKKRSESQNIESKLIEEGDFVQALAISRATNSETSKEIIDFLQNHEDIDVIEQKDALDRLVSPVELVSPAASMRPVRPTIALVPTIGYSPDFTQTSEDLTQTSEELPIEVDNSLINQMVVKEILSDTISSQIEPFQLRDLLEKLDVMYDETKKMNLYHDVYRGLYGKDPPLSLTVENLKVSIDDRFNTRIGWLKRRMNNYINEYFSFANPIIENIKTALEKFKEFVGSNYTKDVASILNLEGGRRLYKTGVKNVSWEYLYFNAVPFEVAVRNLNQLQLEIRIIESSCIH